MKTLTGPVVVLLIVFTFATLGFGQDIVTKPACKPVKVENLTKEVLPLPVAQQRSGARYFRISIDSLSQATISLYDDAKDVKRRILITGDPIAKTAKYEIIGPGQTPEWFLVKYSMLGGKEVARATSSSGRTLELSFTSEEAEKNGKRVRRISTIEGREGEQVMKPLSVAASEAKQRVSDELIRLEDGFYDTVGLKELKFVLDSMDVLQKIVLQSSTVSSFIEEPEGIPDCYVACQRIGTIVPIYACSDDLTNCGRCGVDGFYYIGGYGCIIVCILHCREFYS